MIPKVDLWLPSTCACVKAAELVAKPCAQFPALEIKNLKHASFIWVSNFSFRPILKWPWPPFQPRRAEDYSSVHCFDAQMSAQFSEKEECGQSSAEYMWTCQDKRQSSWNSYGSMRPDLAEAVVSSPLLGTSMYLAQHLHTHPEAAENMF